MYSKLPPDDEQLIYSKYVEDNYWNRLRKKVHLVGSYYANIYVHLPRRPTETSCINAWLNLGQVGKKMQAVEVRNTW